MMNLCKGKYGGGGGGGPARLPKGNAQPSGLIQVKGAVWTQGQSSKVQKKSMQNFGYSKLEATAEKGKNPLGSQHQPMKKNLRKFLDGRLKAGNAFANLRFSEKKGLNMLWERNDDAHGKGEERAPAGWFTVFK